MGRKDLKPAKPKRGICRICGCTETTPCPTGCAWTDKTKTLCTLCARKEDKEIPCLTCANKSLFFTIPRPASKLFHVFREGEFRSLCGRYGLLGKNTDACQPVKGQEKYKRGQDCKDCFRNAGLQVE